MVVVLCSNLNHLVLFPTCPIDEVIAFYTGQKIKGSGFSPLPSVWRAQKMFDEAASNQKCSITMAVNRTAMNRNEFGETFDKTVLVDSTSNEFA